MKAIEEIDRRAIETKEIKVGYDLSTGFIGTKVSGASHLSCTNFDKLLVLYKDGTYKATNIPEKQYFEHLQWVGVADKKTILNVVYKKDGQVWAKRFIVDAFILDKSYRYFDENGELQLLSTHPESAVELQFTPKARQKKLTILLKEIPISGAQTRGTRLSTDKVKKVLSIGPEKGKKR